VDLLNLILDFDPDFQKTLDSEQYFYSEKILEKRIKLKVTQEEYASLLGISLNELLDLEECLLSIPTEEYIKIANIADSIRTDSLDKMVLSKVQKLVKVTKMSAPSENDISLNYFKNIISKESSTGKYILDGFSQLDDPDTFNSLEEKISRLLQHEIKPLDNIAPVIDRHAVTKNKFSQNQISNSNIKFKASVSEFYSDTPAA